MTTSARRMAGYLTSALVGAAAALAAASPASAHTGVTVEPARANAKNAVATVNAEAESQTAGVTKVQVFLPIDIGPDDITQISVPKRWTMTKQPSGYTVEGPALEVGSNAVHKIRIRQLPKYASISFKVLQTYRDGRVDRWIALPTPDDPEPENPAPTVKLAGGSGLAPTATPAASPTATPSTPTPPSAAATTAPATEAGSAEPGAATPTSTDDSSSGSSWWWITGTVVLALLAAGVFLIVRRRRTSI